MPQIDNSTKQQRKDRVWLWVRKYPNGIAQSEIAEETKMEGRTVYNYLVELEREGKIYKDKTLWFPLDFEATRLRSFELTPEEAYSLYLGSRLFVKQQDKRNEAAETALLKLAEVLTSDARVGQEIRQAAQELAARPNNPGYHSVFLAMVRGYIYRKRVAITYKPLNGKEFETFFETYLIEPSTIGYATYVIGHSSTPNALRAYKLERIVSAELTKSDYRVPANFPGLEVLQHSWSIILGEKTVKVVLRFSPRVKERVVETRWHPSEKREDDPEKPDHLRWSVVVADTLDMEPWIRSWGGNCEVLEPKELREKLMGETRAMAMTYGWHVSLQANPAHTSSSTLDDFFQG